MKVSVIVPVYNVEKYLNRCVDSILAQSFSDYEIILVDDGSTDKSGQICDEYEAHYNKVRVIHKKNEGLSATRNRGIQESIGEYLTFVDSDDYVTSDYLATLYLLLTKHHADLSCARFTTFSDSDDLDSLTKSISQRKRMQRCYSGEKACKALLCEKDFQTSSCNILVQRRIAENNLFPIGKFHEDEMTTFRYLYSAKKVVIVDAILYFYYQREGSIMHVFGKPVLDELEAADYYVDTCAALGNRMLQKVSFLKKFSLVRLTLAEYPELKEKYPDVYTEARKYLEKNCLRVLFNPNSSLQNRKIALKLWLRKENI